MTAHTAYRGKAQDHGTRGNCNRRQDRERDVWPPVTLVSRSSRELTALADQFLADHPEPLEEAFVPVDDSSSDEVESYHRRERELADTDEDRLGSGTFFTGSLVRPEDLGWAQRNRCVGYTGSVDDDRIDWPYADRDFDPAYLYR